MPAFFIEGQDRLPEMPVKKFVLIGLLGMDPGRHRREKIASPLWLDTPEVRRRG